jgi:hypothetical protein
MEITPEGRRTGVWRCGIVDARAGMEGGESVETSEEEMRIVICSVVVGATTKALELQFMVGLDEVAGLDAHMMMVCCWLLTSDIFQRLVARLLDEAGSGLDNDGVACDFWWWVLL